VASISPLNNSQQNWLTEQLFGNDPNIESASTAIRPHLATSIGAMDHANEMVETAVRSLACRAGFGAKTFATRAGA